ncbi:MAG: citrate/2-methylcitrate synthase, partial [Planctomycetota bacterium]
AWPVQATIGPGLEGAIACYTQIGHVNGGKGQLTYRGYNIFDLATHSTFEEVAYLLIYGKLPGSQQFERFRDKLAAYRHLPRTLRLLQNFPIEETTPMGGLRLGVNLMRRVYSPIEREVDAPAVLKGKKMIASDEDSIPEETRPMGFPKAVYEIAEKEEEEEAMIEDVCHLISGMATLTAAVARLRKDRLPIEPDPNLSHAANFLYMMNGRRPTAEEARIMDISLILHADHGMNASTFASMVVASTLSDIYFSIGAGVAALSGPLHGGANEQVLYMLEEVHKSGNVKAWYENARAGKRKIMGFGHRVYKTYDPRARILGPVAEYLAGKNPEIKPLLDTAKELERAVVESLGKEKGIFPNVDFYSGLVYKAMGIDPPMFTPIFAVSRVAGWTARCLEYLKNNRIFRPRALYLGDFDTKYVNIHSRGGRSKRAVRGAEKKS